MGLRCARGAIDQKDVGEKMFYVVNTKTNQTLYSSRRVNDCVNWIDKRYTENHPDYDDILIVNEWRT
jgi:hypothetical protein